MAIASAITLLKGTAPATPAAGKIAVYGDTTSGQPYYVDDAGATHSLVGAAGATGSAGPTGNSLARPSATLTSTAGSAVIDLSLGKEVHGITLTENTTITFTNPPASGYVAEVRVRITQHASAAKTCVFSGTTLLNFEGKVFAASTTLSSVQDVGVAVDSSGNVSLYPSAVAV